MADLTPERLQELRRIAEAATPGLWEIPVTNVVQYFATFDPPMVLAMLDEIERLRREVREWMCDGCNAVYPGPPQPGIWCVQCPRCGGDTAPRSVIERRRLEREIERLRREREEIVDSETRFALYDPDLNAWECQADDCRFLWEFESGDPYDHDMRFCPRCGRRIVRGGEAY